MLKLQRSSAIEVYLRKAVLSLGLFCTVALLSAVLYSSIGVSGELNQATFADSSNSTSTISLRVTKNGADITDLNLDLSPTATGAFVKDNLSLLVTTDNATGYKLDFSNTDDDTAMTHTSPATTASIPSITTTTDESSFPVNSWGYSLDAIAGAQTFSPIPTKSNPTTLKTTTAPTTNDQTDITFAIKADTNMPSGTYKDTVVFTAVANYVPNALEQISNMQDMTPQVCQAANVGDTATLKDTRDNKTYVIRKLADGNCWMVQNLDLDLSTSVALTSENTNLVTKSSWTPQNNTQTTEGTVWAGDGGDVARSMDPGNIYFPGGVGTGTADSYNNLQGATSGQPWEHIGNYYNWYSATAGTGTSNIINANAIGSICPTNWLLPSVNDFRSLNATVNPNLVNDTSVGLRTFPNNLTYSGYDNGSSKGTYASYWTSTANYNNIYAQPFMFHYRGVDTQRLEKIYRLSVRCLTPGS